ncbi:MAG TPA: plasmid maintenance system killer protein [Chloroflexi bacterium]|jgi:proteic killer suppression protein|nr:plasmid maintenance system killer protein [Chloroflexota bacterium]
MEVEFDNDDLDRLEIDATFSMGLGQNIVRAFRKVMNSIRSAQDERDFYNNKGLHYEKLSGDRDGQHSMMLNDQFRLILEIDVEKTVRIIEVTDYH